MASLRRHDRSPFWFIRRRDLDTNKWFEKSTGLRADSREDTRKAQRLADKASLEERRVGSPNNNPAFQTWVTEFIDTHWQNAGDSTRRYTVAWRAVKAFLAASDITYPRQVKYRHGAAYIEWRVSNPVHGKHVGHNTALLELKFLSQLMNEAIRREFAEANPLIRMGIQKAAQRIKPEFNDQQIKKLREAFAKEPEWMQRAAEISLYTGCRISECEIPLERVDLRAGTIRLRDAKRKESDPRKYFTVPIHPQLRPLLQRIKKNGEAVTCSLGFDKSRDKNGRINKVIKNTLGEKFTFHCYRVTFVTRCHRGGLSESEAMRLVNHSSQLVHRIYSRLNVEDVRLAQRKIPLPSF